MKSNAPLEPILILHDIRSAHNVGSLFRTADAVGISKIFLTGYSPLPIDSFGKTNKEIAKTALGAEKTLFWKHIPRLNTLLKRLKKEGYTIVAIEQHVSAVPYRNVPATEKIAFILGNEVVGIDEKILEEADVIAYIPMHGKKESLNVSAAGAVALFQILLR